ncbi:solute carrier family 40 member 1-like, partial [Tropilaelaps mercedesae]
KTFIWANILEVSGSANSIVRDFKMTRYTKASFRSVEDDGLSDGARTLRRKHSLEKHPRGRRQDKENRKSMARFAAPADRGGNVALGVRATSTISTRSKPRWRNTTKLYLSRALSSWGDNMWSFAVGLFYIKLYPDSLRLAAIYGFSASVAIILFGAPIGRWVDKTARLKAAKMSLGFQNATVVLCATFLCMVMMFETQLKSQTDEQWVEVAGQGLVVAMAVLSRLGSLANIICVEKDWLIVLAHGSREKLAVMNAMVRRIDMVSKLLAPLFVGQIMARSLTLGAVFLAGWNIVSVYLEYRLLLDLYVNVPVLALKYRSQGVYEDIRPCQRIRYKIRDYLGGWIRFLQHPVCFAGLGLALTFMTVLMFDSITVGYIYKQGISEAVVGFVSAGTGFVGVCGTLAYPWLRRSIGLERTGLLGFLLLISCITLCVASVFVKGSPFDPMLSRLFGDAISNFNSFLGIQLPAASSTSKARETSVVPNLNFTNERMLYFVNDTIFFAEQAFGSSSMPPDSKADFVPHEANLSVLMLVAGMCLARFGLWIADLAVNQFLQELVDDGERGCINGVQYSINVSMDLLKFIMVIFIPWFDTFGLLIIVSFLFSCAGTICFAEFCRRQEGGGRSLFCHFCINCCSRPSEQEDPGTPITEVVDMAHVDELLNSAQVVLENADSGVMFTEDENDSSTNNSQGKEFSLAHLLSSMPILPRLSVASNHEGVRLLQH